MLQGRICPPVHENDYGRGDENDAQSGHHLLLRHRCPRRNQHHRHDGGDRGRDRGGHDHEDHGGRGRDHVRAPPTSCS